jgi:hypothetical protein
MTTNEGIMTHEEPQWLVKQRAEQARTEGPWNELVVRFLGVHRHTGTPGRSRVKTVPVFDRLDKALRAMREFRAARSQGGGRDDEEISLAVGVVADELAGQIAAAATTGQDPATIAWVLAGLRCPRQPFCTGCPSCFTVTAPLRDCGTVTA